MLLFPPSLHKVSQRFALQRYNKKCKYASFCSFFFAYRILFYHYRTTYLLFCKKKCTFVPEFIME